MFDILNEHDLTFWLQQALIGGNFKITSIKVLENTQKSGYLGDIIHVMIKDESKRQNINVNNVVVKYSKCAQLIRKQYPVSAAFNNEIQVYQKILPNFKQFECEKANGNNFQNYPKYLGSLITNDFEMLILENLKSSGFKVLNKTKPMPISRIELALKAYGRFHAISFAMKLHSPDKFVNLSEGLTNIWYELDREGNIGKLFRTSVEDVYNLLKTQLNGSTLEKLYQLKNDSINILNILKDNLTNHQQVIVHGDAWNDNILFQDNNKILPSHLVFIDFQAAHLSSPIFDLSYFLYTCLPKDQLKNLKNFLKIYHDSLRDRLTQLGCGQQQIYCFHQLYTDWITLPHTKFGILQGIVAAKYYQGDNISSNSSTNNETFSDIDMCSVKDVSTFKRNVKLLIDHAVELSII